MQTFEMRPWALAMAMATAALGAQAQSEIQGVAAPTGGPVPKAISVSQAQLSAADKDGTNFLHSNMSYAQTRYYRPLVVSCGTQHSESVVVVEPGGHVGRLPLSLSTCPRGGSREHGIERWSGGAVHQRVGPAATVGG